MTRRTMRAMLQRQIEPVELSDVGVTFASYPFRAASVNSRAELPWADVREAVVNTFPVELRTRGGEVLFVPQAQRDELAAFASARRVPVVRRVDVWALLLEPYLDTEFDAAHERLTLRRLAEAGFDAAEVRGIRRRVGRRVLRYNAVLWDWCHLGLYDLLQAHQPLLPLSRAREATFYAWAMAIAERGPIIDD